MFVKKVAPRALRLLGLLAALTLVAWAQNSPAAAQDAPALVRATGEARTAQGVPVPGATVRLVELSSGRAWLSWTDENGRFDLPGLPAGRYRVEAQQLGFEQASMEIALAAPAAGKEAPIELTLRVAPLASAAPEAAKPAAEATPQSPAARVPLTPTVEATKPATGQAAGGAGDAPSAKKPGQRVPPNIAEMIRQRMGQGGFQQVDPTGQLAGAGQDTTAPADTGPLGEASSSDAFLISGTVGRGTTPGGEGGFNPFGGLAAMGGFGGPGDAGGFPGQPGGPSVVVVQRMGGQGQPGQQGGGRQAQGPGQGGQRGGQGAQRGQQRASFGEGTEGLWGMQRILRQQVNRIRVSFYDRYGNSAFDARPYSLTEANPAKIATYRERFGGNVGGPLRIPHVYDDREKTFFFVNYNGSRTRDPVDTFATVPTKPERTGNFSDRNAQLFDPRSNIAGPRTSFGSVIPSGLLDPTAMGLLQFIPPPNLPGLVQNFHLQTRVPTAVDSLNVRVLHTISSKLNAQATYNLSQTHTHAFQNLPDFESNTSTRGQNIMLGLTQNWTTRFIHDTRVFWNRSRTEALNQFAFNDNIGAALGINGISTDPINFGVPAVGFTNFTDLNDPVPALRRNQTLRFLDNLSYSLPKHTLRAGLEVRRYQVNTRTDPMPRGAFTFTGLMTSQLDSSGRPVPSTGFDFADFLLGLPQSTNERFGTSSTYFRSWGFVGYFQDDWRIHPRFSLNWGLRYEAVTPPIELFDHISNLDLNSDLTAVAVVCTGADAVDQRCLPAQMAPFSGPLPRSLVRGDYNNWSPRIGIAWKPPFKWISPKHPVVVRAGYGMFYNESIYIQLAASMANQPPFAQAQTRLTSAARVLTLEDGFPKAPLDTARNTVAVDPNYRVGYAQIWNFTIETQLAQNTIAEVTYTGTKGTHLDLLRAPNRAPPGSPLDTDQQRRIANASGFTYDTFGASSIYHALQVRVQRRMSRGLMIQGLYTYGKSIDNASSIGGGTPTVVQDDLNPQLDRGLSSFDIRHQFRLAYFYELPFGERKHWAQKGWKSTAFGHWQVSGNTTIATGTPFTARVLGNLADNTGTGANFSERADQVGNASLPSGLRTPQEFFNTAAFVVPLPGFFGDAARNTIPGPGNVTLNMALARWMRFGKDQQRRIDLRWEVSNLLNTPNFTGLSTVVNSSTYGRVLGVRAMRTIDFVLRVNF